MSGQKWLCTQLAGWRHGTFPHSKCFQVHFYPRGQERQSEESHIHLDRVRTPGISGAELLHTEALRLFCLRVRVAQVPVCFILKQKQFTFLKHIHFQGFADHVNCLMQLETGVRTSHKWDPRRIDTFSWKTARWAWSRELRADLQREILEQSRWTLNCARTCWARVWLWEMNAVGTRR